MKLSSQNNFKKLSSWLLITRVLFSSPNNQLSGTSKKESAQILKGYYFQFGRTHFFQLRILPSKMTMKTFFEKKDGEVYQKKKWCKIKGD